MRGSLCGSHHANFFGDVVGFFRRRYAAFGEQQPPQSTEIIHDAPAGSDMKMEFGEIESYQQQSLFAAICLFLIGDCDFRIHIASGFIEGLGQQF